MIALVIDPVPDWNGNGYDLKLVINSFSGGEFAAEVSDLAHVQIRNEVANN
ncbi:MAG TPA: hypothetical protein PKD54_13650 [Pirellulaceae bacterium]|nr:hypothetical protein [Pirellulaceae bacterium]